MSRYSVLHRFLEWTGSAGGFAFGNTRRSFPEPPDLGIDGMAAVDYRPHESRHQVRIDDQPWRELTALELMGIEDRMYMADRGAGDPFRRGWKLARGKGRAE